MFTTNVEFNGVSFAIYRNGILCAQQKILEIYPSIYPSVICAHMVDSSRPGHILAKINIINILK